MFNVSHKQRVLHVK